MRKNKNERKRVSLYEFMSRFETEQDAMAYIEAIRWVQGRSCPRCGSEHTSKASHKTMPCETGASHVVSISALRQER